MRGSADSLLASSLEDFLMHFLLNMVMQAGVSCVSGVEAWLVQVVSQTCG